MCELLGSRWHKFCVFLGCTLSLLLFQNCSQNFEATQLATQASTPETPTPPPVSPPEKGMVHAFMATGHVGRTVFSCDDGRTWIHDRSDNDNTRCWVTGDPNYVECDHTNNAGRGVDAGDGWFFANFGWGQNGSVRRSRDGINWEIMNTTGNGGGLSYVDGQLYVSWFNGLTSSDLGLTWQNHPANPKRDFAHPWMRRAGNVIAMIGRPTGLRKISFSFDAGRTWILPAALQNEQWIRTFNISPSGRIVVVGHLTVGSVTTAHSAISDDNGTTWIIQQHSDISAQWDELFFDGQKFVTFASGRRWTSANGLNWESSAFTVSDRSASTFDGPASYDPTTGTYVRIFNTWGNFYDRQKAYRSTDGGLSWQVLSSSSFRGGHPIRDIQLGTLESTYCP